MANWHYGLRGSNGSIYFELIDASGTTLYRTTLVPADVGHWVHFAFVWDDANDTHIVK